MRFTLSDLLFLLKLLQQYAPDASELIARLKLACAKHEVAAIKAKTTPKTPADTEAPSTAHNAKSSKAGK